MATAKKTTVRKSAAAKEQTPAEIAAEEAAERRAEREERDAELQARVVELRDEDTSWADIASELEIGQGKCMVLFARSQVKPKDRIKGDDDEMGAAIVEARANGESWGWIAARASIGEGRVRSLFEEASGESAAENRLGKGGRWPAGVTPSGAGAKPAAKTAKKAPAAKKAASTKDAGPIKNLNDMNLVELSRRLNGKDITVAQTGGKQVKIGVKEVTGLEDGEMEFVDAKSGAARTILVKNIKRASR